MKRTGNLISRIADPENLRVGFRKASSGKQQKKEVTEFRNRLETNLQGMREDLLQGTIELGNYHYFTIFDPKERQICAASFPERVLHHSIMNQCESVFEKAQIYHSYACRKGKGQFAAIYKAQKFSRSYAYFLKLDIRKYFDSIDHRVLLTMLDKKFKDIPLLLLFQKLIDTYCTKEGKGLPIGNLTSQYFANNYLTPLDRYVTENLKCGGYIRYMDDFILWDTSKEKLRKKRKEIREFLIGKLKLSLKQVSPAHCVKKGISFLGFRVFPHRLHLTASSKKRFIRKYRKYLQMYGHGEFDELQLQGRFQSLFSLVRHGDCKRFQHNVLKRFGDIS